MKIRSILLVLSLLILTGCAVNPVTGKNELSLVSEAQELAMGQKNYAPARQSQGGDYTVDPQLTAYVSSVGQRLAAVSDRKLPYEFKVLNSSVPNAWAMPGGKIAINRGLLTELKSESELAAVLGHEIVHAAARHTAQQQSKGMLLQVGLAGVSLATQGESYGQLAQMGAGIGAQLITTKYGRDAERESDFYGMQYMVRAGYNPQGAVDLQKTFVKLSEDRRQDWLSGLFASHPPSQERVQNNVELLKTLPKGGETGTERWQAKTRHLLRTKPAYEAYDKGREALVKNDLSTADRLAQQAIRIEPKEALFYGLRGDVAQENNRLTRAVGYYDKAARLNPSYFYPYLQRGRTYERLNRPTMAQTDLEKSIQLLPTRTAYHSLGNLARRSGDMNRAKNYYAKVAGTKGAIGLEAYAALVDLDLKENPDKYLKARTGQDRKGRIVAQITNPTPRNVRSLRLEVRYKGLDGRTQGFRRDLRGTLKAGSKKRIDLGLSGKLTAKQLKTLQAKVIRARVAR